MTPNVNSGLARSGPWEPNARQRADDKRLEEIEDEIAELEAERQRITNPQPVDYEP